MNIQLKEITPNKKNPRFIRDEQFEKLKRSVAQFPAMLEKRGLAVRKQGKKWEAIGGNMRLRALTDLQGEMSNPERFMESYGIGKREIQILQTYFSAGIPCIDCSDFTPEEVQRFVIADNVPFGEWDTEVLANEWDTDDLGEWGLEFEFEQPEEEEKESVYTKKKKPIIYNPRGEQPDIKSLYDRAKAESLLLHIEQAEIPEDVKQFLRAAAERHTVINFEATADYYAHAPADIQRLFEDSALVLIDFDKAYEKGYVQLSKALENEFLHEQEEN